MFPKLHEIVAFNVKLKADSEEVNLLALPNLRPSLEHF